MPNPIRQHGYTPEVIVLANGAFPQAGEALELMERWMSRALDCPLICCDGAVNKLLEHTDRLPDAVVGDLDSIWPANKALLSDRLYHISEQETNDLTKAMHHLHRTLGKRRVAILGGSGGREDHALGVLALLPGYLSLCSELRMMTDYGTFLVLEGDSAVEVSIGQQLSLFSFVSQPLTLTGVHWPLQGTILPELWCGTLNRASEPLVVLSAPRAPVLLYLASVY